MRLAISGSRWWPAVRRRELCSIFYKFYKQQDCTHVQVGDARGVDAYIIQHMDKHGYKYQRYDALWNEYGKSAGHIRNGEILVDSDILLAFPLEESVGTWNCIKQALKKGIPVYVYQNGEVKLHERSVLPKDDTLFSAEPDSN